MSFRANSEKSLSNCDNKYEEDVYLIFNTDKDSSCGFQALSKQATLLDLPKYKPRSPWLSGDLQTLRNKIVSPTTQLEKYRHIPLLLPLKDNTGDALVATLYLPNSGGQPKFTRPLFILFHGLGGSAKTNYMKLAADYLLAKGYPVLTVDLRGVERSGPYCRYHNHPGRSEDIADSLTALKNRLRSDVLEPGVMLMGFSMGGNIVLKFLGEQPDHPLLRGGVTVSAPLDLTGTARSLKVWHNVGYQQYLLHRIRNDSLRPTIDISDEERNIIKNASSVWEVDEKFTAPHLGFPNVEAYYEQFSAKNFLDQIKVPTLLIHALDDPFVPNETFLEFDWDKNPALHPILVKSGGHAGFHGQGSPVPWHNRCAVEFVKHINLSSINRCRLG